MNNKFKAILAILAVCIVYTPIMYQPTIIASFDDDKYIDREVFTLTDGKYDFRKFSLKSPDTKNYTAVICFSGYVQMVDDTGNRTINVFEWDKMTYTWKSMENKSISNELERPSRLVDGMQIIDVLIYSNRTLYASPSYDPSTNTLIYIATPSETDTIEMMETLEFKDTL